MTLLLGSAIQVKVTGSPGPFDVRGCAGKAAASFGGNVLTVQGIGPGGCRLIATDRKNGATVSVRVTVLETSGN